LRELQGLVKRAGKENHDDVEWEVFLGRLRDEGDDARCHLGSKVKLRTLQVCTDEPTDALVWKPDTLR
jgi:hypothetical protein